MRALRLLVLPLLLLPLGLVASGCGSSVSGPDPEVQQQNFDDEQKAMENAEQQRTTKGRPSGI